MYNFLYKLQSLQRSVRILQILFYSRNESDRKLPSSLFHGRRGEASRISLLCECLYGMSLRLQRVPLQGSRASSCLQLRISQMKRYMKALRESLNVCVPIRRQLLRLVFQKYLHRQLEKISEYLSAEKIVLVQERQESGKIQSISDF